MCMQIAKGPSASTMLTDLVFIYLNLIAQKVQCFIQTVLGSIQCLGNFTLVEIISRSNYLNNKINIVSKLQSQVTANDPQPQY